MSDPHNLNRFITAQEPVYEDVCRELAARRKTSHWIWFIFPQMKGLGMSHNSEFYGMSSLEEAKAYLEHPVLGPRLRHCTDLVVHVTFHSIERILGEIDAQKFRSCMTLFAIAAPEQTVFQQALRKYFKGKRDERTVEMAARPQERSQ